MAGTGIEKSLIDASILAKNQINDFSKTPIALDGNFGMGESQTNSAGGP